MNKKEIIKDFIEAVDYMKRTKCDGTYHWIIDGDYNNDWALVLGWADGFEKEADDDCTDGTWRLCAKIAYQPNNSIMQCDYDIDWIMPYDEESGEVDDNEISIYPDTYLEELVNDLFEWYEDYKNENKTMDIVYLDDITGTLGEWLDAEFDDKVSNEIIELLIQAYDLAANEL